MHCPWFGSLSTNIEFFWTQLSAEFKRSDYWLLLRSAFVCTILFSAGKIVHKPSLPHLSRHGAMQSAWTVFLLSCAFIVLCFTCLSINAMFLHKALVLDFSLYFFYAAIGLRGTILSDIPNSKLWFVCNPWKAMQYTFPPEQIEETQQIPYL